MRPKLGVGDVLQERYLPVAIEERQQNCTRARLVEQAPFGRKWEADSLSGWHQPEQGNERVHQEEIGNPFFFQVEALVLGLDHVGESCQRLVVAEVEAAGAVCPQREAGRACSIRVGKARESPHRQAQSRVVEEGAEQEGHITAVRHHDVTV